MGNLQLRFRAGRDLSPEELREVAADLRAGIEALDRVRWKLNGRVLVATMDRLCKFTALQPWTWLRNQLDEIWRLQSPNDESPFSGMPT